MINLFLELRMLDLFPEKIVGALRQSMGRQFDQLPELENPKQSRKE
ncbi:MAG: hypothetical protein QM498_10915 [Desulfobacterium sp.]